MPGLVGGLVVPGLAFYLRGPRRYGRFAMGSCALLLSIFIVLLGYPLANLALALMISIHVTGFLYYCGPDLRPRSFRQRINFTLLVLAAIGLGLYLPVQHVIQNHWLMPLRNGDQVVVISSRGGPATLQRGDWAAFSSEKGLVFGPVVGLGGEQVDSVKVPEGHWLIRVRFLRQYYHDGLVPGMSTRSDIVEQSMVVSRDDFVGKPFKRWFWREQVLP